MSRIANSNVSGNDKSNKKIRSTQQRIHCLLRNMSSKTQLGRADDSASGGVPHDDDEAFDAAAGGPLPAATNISTAASVSWLDDASSSSSLSSSSAGPITKLSGPSSPPNSSSSSSSSSSISSADSSSSWEEAASARFAMVLFVSRSSTLGRFEGGSSSPGASSFSVAGDKGGPVTAGGGRYPGLDGRADRAGRGRP